MKKKIELHHLSRRTMVHSLAIVLLLSLLITANIPHMRWVMALIMSGLSGWASLEFLTIAKNKGTAPATVIGPIISACFVFLSFIAELVHKQDPTHIYVSIPWIFLLITLPSLCFIKYGSMKASPTINTGIMFFGVLYPSIPFRYALEILYSIVPDSQSRHSIWWMAFILAVTKSSDLFGYFFGKIFGKKKLAPTISPSKTIVGALGGFLGSLFVAWIFFITLPNQTSYKLSNLFLLLGFGAILSLMGILGDLFESIFKRDAAVKDSGPFKGVGGFLDNVDSLLLSIPTAYLILQVLHHTNLYFLF